MHIAHDDRKLFGTQSGEQMSCSSQGYIKVLRKLKIRPFAITAPSKRGSLQVSVYQMHAFIVILDLHGVTCLCSYWQFLTSGN